MSNQIHRDKNGREIRPGDLVRSPHFRERQRRRMNYLYHTVVMENGRLWMVPTSHLEPTLASEGGKCLLRWLHPEAEIIDGVYPWWRDRPQVREGDST